MGTTEYLNSNIFSFFAVSFRLIFRFYILCGSLRWFKGGFDWIRRWFDCFWWRLNGFRHGFRWCLCHFRRIWYRFIRGFIGGLHRRFFSSSVILLILEVSRLSVHRALSKPQNWLRVFSTVSGYLLPLEYRLEVVPSVSKDPTGKFDEIREASCRVFLLAPLVEIDVKDNC